jgi:hypothetical protein
MGLPKQLSSSDKKTKKERRKMLMVWRQWKLRSAIPAFNFAYKKKGRLIT